MIRILLIDDRALVRLGLNMRLSLEDDYEVIGEATTGAEGLAQAAALQPDVAIVDLALPDMTGMSVIQRLQQVAPDCAVIVLTLYDSAANRLEAKAARAAAFVSKVESAENLITAVRQVHQAHQRPEPPPPPAPRHG